MQDIVIGDAVTYEGRVFEVLRMQGDYVGLVDLARPPMIDESNGQQVAHIAVRRAELVVA